MLFRPGSDAERPAPPAVDPLSIALGDLRAAWGRVYASRLPSGWALRFPATDGWALHALRRGEGWCWVGDRVHELRVGEVVLLPHGDAHALGTHPNGLEVGFPAAPVAARDWTRGEPVAAEIVCGQLRVSEGATLPLLASLPSVLTVSGDAAAGVLDLLFRESDGDRPAASAVITRLGEVLALQGVRVWAASAAEVPAWVRAARDPGIGAALAAIHADPGAPWTLERMSRAAGASRSRFAAKFRSLLGVPPATYVQRVRLERAAAALSAGDVRVSDLAYASGYASPAAFSRAFKRATGTSPRAYSTG